MTKSENKKRNTHPIISYLGNLGLGRHESLIEIAQALQSINPEYKLDVYGKIPTDEIENLISNCSAISYKGFVQYEDVVAVMNTSDILVHAESFSDFYRDDSKYAFSTKIADCLKVGTCFFNYAPKELASSQYLINNDVACVVTEKDKLTETLFHLINDEKFRDQFVSHAVSLALKNHDSKRNGEFMAEIIRRVVYESIAS